MFRASFHSVPPPPSPFIIAQVPLISQQPINVSPWLIQSNSAKVQASGASSSSLIKMFFLRSLPLSLMPDVPAAACSSPRLLTLMCKWRGSPQGKQMLQQPGQVTHGGSRWPQARVWAPGNTANGRKEICQGPDSYQSTGLRDHKMKTLIKKQTLLPWALGNRDFQ